MVDHYVSVDIRHDSVSFVLFVYLCIYSTRFMVNKVIQRPESRNLRAERPQVNAGQLS